MVTQWDRDLGAAREVGGVTEQLSMWSSVSPDEPEVGTQVRPELERWAELEPPYRWVLGRRWDPGLPTLAWIMLNPSTADGTDDDPTMGKVMEFTRLAGYGCCVVVNAFPFMATDPKDLLRVLAEDRERALGPMQTAADMGAHGPGLVLWDWDGTADAVWSFRHYPEHQAWTAARKRQTVRRGVVKGMAARRRAKSDGAC